MPFEAQLHNVVRYECLAARPVTRCDWITTGNSHLPPAQWILSKESFVQFVAVLSKPRFTTTDEQENRHGQNRSTRGKDDLADSHGDANA